jgi:hypothetical protein
LAGLRQAAAGAVRQQKAAKPADTVKTANKNTGKTRNSFP